MGETTKIATDKRGAHRTTKTTQSSAVGGAAISAVPQQGTLEERGPEATPFFLTASKATCYTWAGERVLQYTFVFSSHARVPGEAGGRGPPAPLRATPQACLPHPTEECVH